MIVDGVDLIRGRRVADAEIVAEIRRGLPPLTRRRVLVEAYVEPEHDDRVRPLEIKCFVFGDRIAGFEVVDREARAAEPRRVPAHFRDEQWRPLPNLRTNWTGWHPDRLPPPNALDEIGAHARRLGRAYETFVRADFYAAAAGAVFGEFAATPGAGRNFTAWGDHYLGEIWSETFPRAI